MSKVLIIWDVKSRGTPATMFYRALRGYDYRTKNGRNHSPGVLDELPGEVWEFVNRSTLLIEEKYAKLVEKVFKDFAEYLDWHVFEVERVR